MIAYAQKVSTDSYIVNVGFGDNIDFYKSIGMKKMEVEQGYDGAWYIAGHAPEKPQSVIDEERRQEILAELDRIDRASARSLRACMAAQNVGNEPSQADVLKLAEYEAQAMALREELAGLDA